MEQQIANQSRDGNPNMQTLKDEGKNLADKAVKSLQSDTGASPHQEEGTITKQIENLTSKVPSGTFLTFALGAVGASLFMQLAGRKKDAQFVGQWVPTILLLGLYNKLVKLHGSE